MQHHHILAGALIAAVVTIGAGPHGRTAEAAALAAPIPEIRAVFTACRDLALDGVLDLSGEIIARIKQL